MLFLQLGKVFPKLRRKGRGSVKRHSKDSENSTDEDSEASDYVFRIITSLKPDSICKYTFWCYETILCFKRIFYNVSLKSVLHILYLQQIKSTLLALMEGRKS